MLFMQGNLSSFSLLLAILYVIHTFAVCETTFETWADALSGHNKICTDLSGVV